MPWHLPATLMLITACSPESRYQRIVDGVESPGAILTIRTPAGEVWQGTSGVSRADDVMTPDHQILVGSNTKTMTATIVLQLVDDDLLSLDDLAATWVDNLHPDITVRDLLQHTSGLGEYFSHPSLADGPKSQADRYWAPEALLALATDVRDDGPAVPGEYSNANFIAAGLIIEAIEERPLDEVFQDRIFTPLDMAHSGFLLSGDPLPEMVAWGNGGELGAVTAWDASVGWAAGSAFATGGDLSRFLGAVMEGELLSDEMYAAQFTPVESELFLGEGLDQRYGLGVMMVGVGNTDVHGHWGGVDGFTTAAFADPQTNAQVVLMANQGGADIASAALKALRIAASQ